MYNSLKSEGRVAKKSKELENRIIRYLVDWESIDRITLNPTSQEGRIIQKLTSIVFRV
jgi:hypothetical protein